MAPARPQAREAAAPLHIVVLGLSLSSSWGNGHATTYRALLRGLAELGHEVLFLERDVPWYGGDKRDLPDPGFCDLRFYGDLADLATRFGSRIDSADVVIVGSYVPEGIAVLDLVLERAQGRIAFYDIDTPITLEALGRGEETYIARRQIPALDLYLSFTGGPTLGRLERDFGAPAAAALYCSVDTDAYRPTGEDKVWDLGYLGTYSPDRQPTLDALLIEPARRLADRRFVVAGPGYPADIAWPANVERIDHLPPPAHASFYSRQRFTLNVTRRDMRQAGWSPSVRLFEAASCATAILSDRWEGLDEILRGAVEIVDTADDVTALLARPAGTQDAALAAQARRTAVDDHSGRRRAAELVALLQPARLAAPDRVPGGEAMGRPAGHRATFQDA